MIEWRTSKPGDIGRVRAELSPDDPTAVLVHNGIPDRVIIPANCPLYAGEEREVIRAVRAPCPHKGCECEPLHIQLRGAGWLWVAGCQEYGWTVYQLR